MVSPSTAAIYRADARASGALLSKEEREELVRPYLPQPPVNPQPQRRQRSKPIRSFIKSQVYLLLFNVIHFVFSIYIRLRRFYHSVSGRIAAVLYYHHRTPELIRKDVRNLSKLPEHLSIALEISPPSKRPRRKRDHSHKQKDHDALERFLDDVAEVSAWCACAGIPTLSVYERTGALKRCIPETHRAVATKLHAYFGKRRPSLQVRAPHMQTFLNGDASGEEEDGADGAIAESMTTTTSETEPALGTPTATATTATATKAAVTPTTPADKEPVDLGHLSLLLLSDEDGRSTMVDLTRTLAEMAQQRKLGSRDVTWELIDSELRESVMAEPDLLILFGDHVALDRYPPWPLRLTEIFHRQDNQDVEYTVWLQGLHRFAKAQMRFGR